MEYAAALLTQGVLWVYLSGFSLGAAGGQVIRRLRKGVSWVNAAALLTSCALIFFSLGLILVPQFVRQINLLPVLLVLLLGILCGVFPKVTVPSLLVLIAVGGILISQSITSMNGYLLNQGPVEILILRADRELGSSLELRYQGFSEIHSLSDSRIRLSLLSFEIPAAVIWPEHRYISLIGLIGESGGESGGTEVAVPANPKDAQGAGRSAALLEKIGIITVEEVSGPELSIEAMLNYRLEERDGKILVSPLSFRRQTSDTGEE